MVLGFTLTAFTPPPPALLYLGRHARHPHRCPSSPNQVAIEMNLSETCFLELKRAATSGDQGAAEWMQKKRRGRCRRGHGARCGIEGEEVLSRAGVDWGEKRRHKPLSHNQLQTFTALVGCFTTPRDT